jgi:hypothetical protein
MGLGQLICQHDSIFAIDLKLLRNKGYCSFDCHVHLRKESASYL